MNPYQAQKVCELLNEQVFESETMNITHLETIYNSAASEDDIIKKLIYLAGAPGKHHRIYNIIKAFDWEF